MNEPLTSLGRSLSQNRLYFWRRECHVRFGPILQLPVVSSIYEEIRRLHSGGPILDIGAGSDKPLQKILGLTAPPYFSLDVDPEGEFDYGGFEDIPPATNFDLVVMSQLLEHLSIPEAWATLQGARQVVSTDGALVVGVPNAHHPVRFHSTITHITNWPYNDLYAMLREAGFIVRRLLRTNKSPLTHNPLKAWIVMLVCRELRIDWCDSLILTARPEP